MAVPRCKHPDGSMPVRVKDDSALDALSACYACDWLHERAALVAGEQARCARCGHQLESRKLHTIDRTLAASLAGIVLLVMSLSLPFLTLSRSGIRSSISVLDSVRSLWLGDMRWLGVLTFAFIVLLPLVRLLLLSWVLLRIRLNQPAKSSSRTAFRWALAMEPWAMADIFMVGVAISLVKISSLARLEVGLAFWTLMGLIVVSLLGNQFLSKDTVWNRLTISD